MKTIGDLDSGQQLLVRIDINAPVENGRVKDHSRFERHAETISELLAEDHAVALIAHQGRPGRDTYVSLEQHAEILAGHLETSVEFVPGLADDQAITAIENLDKGEVLLLENVRFDEEELADRTPEEHAEAKFVQTLSGHFDAYVNDGYSVAHRAHASIVGFPEIMDAYAGTVMEEEYRYNTSLQTRDFDGQVVMVLGGKKASDVIDAMEHLEDRVDRFLLGGVVGELFLRASGHPVGYDIETDIYDQYYEDCQEKINQALDKYGDRIELPVDLAYRAGNSRAEHRINELDEKTVDYLDIGQMTISHYVDIIEESDAVLVKGALGVFEDELFNSGTVELLEAIGATDCFSVIGGGDTSRAVRMYALDPKAFDHLSIAGGAYIRALTGEPLPGIEALQKN